MEIQEALENDVQDVSFVQKNVPACSQKKGIAAPEERRVKLVLAPRTKPMEPSVTVSDNSVFGGAKPVDTAAREKEIQERLDRENGTIPKYPKVKREVRKFTSSVIGNNFKLSSYLYNDDHRLVPCYKSPIRECNPEPEQVCKLFIGGLNHETTEETLKGHFEKWGEITQCVIPRNPRSKNSRGFAFVTYKMAHMVQDAIAAGPQQIDGHQVEPKRALSKEQHYSELHQRSNTLHQTRRTRAEPTGNNSNVGKKAKKTQLDNKKLGSRSNYPSANSKDDSESKQEMVKETLGKTQKRKQNQTDKIVSFQIPGKNTPDKNSVAKQGTSTPNKIKVAKKQAVPAKTNLKEFKGLLASDSAKKNGKQSKKQEESDDDDENVDDDDQNMDDDADPDFLFDLDMLLGRENDEDNGDDEDDADLDTLIGGEDDADRDVLLGDEDDDDLDMLLGDDGDDDLDMLLGGDDEDYDLNMLLGGEDDDKNDNEEDKEEEQISPKKNQSKQSQTPSSKKEQSFAQNKTPMKNAGNTVIKEKKTPKDRKPKKSGKTPEKTVDKSPEKQVAKDVQNQKGAQTAESNETPKAFKEALELAEERIRDRDSRTLYIGTLPGDITPTEVKSLSNDIISVTMPRMKDKKKRKFAYAFTEFVSETKAEKNYKILKGKKLRGQPITVDYTGHKRQNQKGEPVPDPQIMNMKILYVTKLPIDTTIDNVASMFPKALQIQINEISDFRSACINFQTEELAAEAMTASKDFKINGRPVIVLYSHKKSEQKKKKSRKKSKSKNQQKEENKKNKLEIKKESEDYNQPQKKIKLEIKQESEDENQPQKNIKLEIKQEREDEE